MFYAFVFGTNWKYDRKTDGLVANKYCPNCHRQGDFFEVIPTKYFTLFWIPIYPTETKNPLLECPNCSERFYIQNQDYYSAKRSPGVIEMPPATKEKHGDSNNNCVFECETCLQKLRIPLKKEIMVVHCPKCNKDYRMQDGKII